MQLILNFDKDGNIILLDLLLRKQGRGSVWQSIYLITVQLIGMRTS